MRVCKLTMLLVIFLGAGVAQGDSRPSITPLSIEQVIDRTIAQEAALVSSLKDYSPLAETYVQEMKPDPELGGVPESDEYFLSRVHLTNGVTDVSMLERQGGFRHMLASKFSNPFRMAYVGVGFLQGTIVDGQGFDRKYYYIQYLRREFLGDVRCYVFDVTPKKNVGSGRFLGRIWVEDQSYYIVRLSGVRIHAPHFHYYFHFDSWRLNMGPGRWLPAYTYTEESDLRFSVFKHAHLKAQTRLWGYDLKNPNRQEEYSNILVDSAAVNDRSDAATDPSPVQALRMYEQQSENNVVEKLVRGGLLAPPGNFEKVLDTVVNNLIVTNNLELPGEVHCRVLLTAPLESFTIGTTIVVSRGLVDTLPDEASLAMILAHELAHVTLGHQVDTKYAFSDRVIFDDVEALARFNFAHDPNQEAAADKKAMEILSNSPYKGKLDQGGLFLRALSARFKELPNLVSAHLGNRMMMSNQAMRMAALENAAPALDLKKLDQIAALPLGARLKVDPWSDVVEMMKSKAVAAMVPREKMPFEVTPFMPYLTRKLSPPPTSAGVAAQAAPQAAPVSRSGR